MGRAARDRTPNAALHEAGFNILTWDSRGFGDSGGTATIDYRKNEGRDVRVLLDWVARQKEAKLDGRRDPRVGMYGGSYAGGIQFVAAAIDRRIDAITPSIAWHSLVTSLYRAETVKGGWASLLYTTGQATGRLDPHIASAFASGAVGGSLSAEDRAWFASRGPGALVRRIKVPTLILQGTPDTLFTPSEAIDNYRILRRKKVPVKMLWFCGGHGTCLTGEGTPGHVERRAVAWLKRYVMRRKKVRTGPGFEWLADDAVWRSARAFPPRPGAPVVGEGSGTLAMSPADAVSGSPTVAKPAANAVNVPIPQVTAQVVGRAASASDLLRHGRRQARVRADRRRAAQRRARQPGHADPGETRRRLAHGDPPPRRRRRGGRPLPAPDHRRQPGLRTIGARSGRDQRLGGPDRAADYFSLKRLRALSIDSSASSRGYQPSTLTTFHSGVL